MDSKEKLDKISDIIDGLPRLKVFDAELTAFEESNPYNNLFPIVDKNTYVGLEMEIENVECFVHNGSPYWRLTEDGSLRNHGYEFITPPIRAWRVEHALHQLLTKQIPPDVEYSDRTSVHVHINVRTLTVPQLEALVLTYLLFEKTLFSWIGHNRYENIFCVPICETNMGLMLDGLIQRNNPHITWQKYTALNLLPITEKGTIEFRHLHGTGDIKKIITWINLILSLKKFALRHEPDYIWHRIRTLNTSSEYRMFGEEVFGVLIEELYGPAFAQQVEECSIYIKNTCLPNDFKTEIIGSISDKSPLHKYKHSNNIRGVEVRQFVDEWVENNNNSTFTISRDALIWGNNATIARFDSEEIEEQFDEREERIPREQGERISRTQEQGAQRTSDLVNRLLARTTNTTF